jgi:hypothetical protein
MMPLKSHRTILGIGCLAAMMILPAPGAAAAQVPPEAPNPATDIDPVEASRNQHYDQPCRPQFHYTPIQGHIGDATGLIYYRGEYHLFYMGSLLGTHKIVR